MRSALVAVTGLLFAGAFLSLAAAPASAGPAAPSLVWAAPVTIASTQGGITGLSCPSVGLCVGVTGDGNAVTSTDPTGGASAWTATIGVDLLGPVHGISCPSASLCAAVDGLADVVTSTHPTGGASAWSSAPYPFPGLESVSCPSIALCVAVGQGGVGFVSTAPANASSWTPMSVGPTTLNGVSCPSTTLCVAVGGSGSIVASPDPSAPFWPLAPDADTHSILGVSCPNISFCAAVDSAGNLLTSTDPAAGPWTLTSIDPGSELLSIACPATNLCVAGAQSGQVLVSTNPTGGASAWSVAASSGGTAVTSVSCSGTAFCVAGDGDGVIVGAAAVTAVQFSASPATSAAASEWTVGLDTSAGGALAAGTGTIVLAGPSGTVFPGLASDYTINGTAVTQASVAGGNQVTLTVPAGVSASTAVTVVASGVTNPAAGDDPASDFSVWTSADLATVHPSTGIDFAVPDGTGTMVLSPAEVDAGSVGNTLTFTYTAAAAGLSGGALTIAVPSGWSAPTTTPGTAGDTTASSGTVSVSGQTIQVTGLTLAGGSTLTVVYGSGGGGAGVAVPGTMGVSTFRVQEQSTSGGTLTPLGASPTVSVGAALSVATSSLPRGTVGAPYSALLVASGGQAPYTWTAAGLPQGLAVTVTGAVYAIAGTPTTAGTTPVTLTVTDATGTAVSQNTSLTIDDAGPALSITTASLPDATLGLPYDQTLQAAGGTPPYTWALTSGTLPAGLTLDAATGAVSGTPTSTGTTTFHYLVTDASHQAQGGSASITVDGTDGSISLTAVPGSVPAGGTAAIDGTVSGSVYQGGEFLVGPLAGVPVSLSATRGDGSAPTGDLPGEVTTGPAGTFTAAFEAPSVPGAVTVSASVYSAVYGTETAQTVLIVTPVGASTEGTDTAASAGGCGTSTARFGDTSETGCGAGVLIVAQYSGNPAQTSALTGALTYFDAALSTGNTFSSVTIEECGVQAGDIVEWWNPSGNSAQGAWEPVSPAATLQGSCLEFIATSSTSPSLSQLFGTVFSIVAPTLAPTFGTAVSVSPATGPAVTGLSPVSGSGAGGTLVRIVGNGFTGATAVDFGSAAAASFRVLSAGEILAVSPAGSGSVPVRVGVGGVQSPSGPANTFTYTACAASFPDVTVGYWARGPIEVLACNGIVSGFRSGLFEPDGSVTRAQFVKMLDLVLGLPVASTATAFADVPADAWYAPYVSAAVNAGIVQGVTATTFDPNGTLTREQMAVLLARALKLTQTQALTFSDASSIAPWATAGVQEAVAAGYISGFPGGTFEPQGPATRAQAAQILNLVLQQRA